ncbi:hypothetical protein [Mesorhizobium sp. SP-1A]|uniref:hypothetical protein n=1 Tax=Mesorhizobium sp. SP-1A TaxID=3077840 RepID=UPI0028F6D6E2|nr:hypothetical protein [Mesorhizobium sp. SP-1A]
MEVMQGIHMIRKTFVTATLGIAMLAPTALKAQGLEPFEAYWVFVGATKGSYEESGAKGRAIESAARKCGFVASSEPSFKFSNKTGMTFYFLEDYFSPQVHGTKAKAKAEAVRDKVKKCIPDAYVKKAWYAGE